MLHDSDVPTRKVKRSDCIIALRDTLTRLEQKEEYPTLPDALFAACVNGKEWSHDGHYPLHLFYACTWKLAQMGYRLDKAKPRELIRNVLWLEERELARLDTK